MCLGVGAPQGVKDITNAQGTLFDRAMSQAKTEFGDASSVFNDLKSSFEPIVKNGPSQQGWSAAEASAINSASITNTGTQYRNAATTVREAQAAGGGGTVALPSGVNIASQLALSEAGAAQTSSELNQNLIQNYETGRQNYEFAAKGLEAAPGVFNTANQATSESGELGNDAIKGQQVRSSYPTWSKMALGALGGAAGFALGGPAGAALGESMTSGVTSTGQSKG